MTLEKVLQIRMSNHQLKSEKYKHPENIINWYGAIQAQDYPSSKWAIGLRVPGSTDQTIEETIAKGKIVRSWLMRGTLHITTGEDIHWILDLLAPRIIKSTAGRNRQLELDEATFSKSNNLLSRLLHGGKQISRDELSKIFEKEGISTKGQRFYHLLHRAALEKLICFGTKQGNQFSFVLLDNVVNHHKPKTRQEALGELTKRYFQSRGPATLEDFVWWSGLTKTDAREGLGSIKSIVIKENILGQNYYVMVNEEAPKSLSHATFLLPAFDEYVLAYRDRSAILATKNSKQVVSKNGIFYPVILHNGKVPGTWRRTLKKDQMNIEINPFEKLTKATMDKIHEAAEAFGLFTGKTTRIS